MSKIRDLGHRNLWNLFELHTRPPSNSIQLQLTGLRIVSFFFKVRPRALLPPGDGMRHVTRTTKSLLKVRKSRMRTGKRTNKCLFTVREVFPQQNPTWFEAIGQSWAKKSHGCGTDHCLTNDRGGDNALAQKRCVHNLTGFPATSTTLSKIMCPFRWCNTNLLYPFISFY